MVVLAAFAVVLATLVIQGGTLAPMIHLLQLGRQTAVRKETDVARAGLAEAAVARLASEEGPEAAALIAQYAKTAADPGGLSDDRRRGLLRAATLAQRQRLHELRDADLIGATQYLELQEDLDWQQLAAESEKERRITES
ncbi:NhaP-type Na+/H+ or K+/H+ antiporter [Rhizobium pisi]|uniref:NhaP-type Na+/H+ or K+/H+ antiporter n=1 Tax=Rhizobium pisi TaxID=574561 RepID=A0A427M5G8_9HYPH|nr:hypothetical protein [Rhizobium pisi]MBB3139077.1 NhaP-type Na+/H+ or K+/H+ antiporter [Rhizobium pisi]RSB59389.1 hypothetical protein EFD55_32590 [Rhizobium pisi]